MIPEDQKNVKLHNNEVRGDILQPPNRHLTALKKLSSRCSKNEKNNGKYWSSYVQWRNLLLLTPLIQLPLC